MCRPVNGIGPFSQSTRRLLHNKRPSVVFDYTASSPAMEPLASQGVRVSERRGVCGVGKGGGAWPTKEGGAEKRLRKVCQATVIGQENRGGILNQ